MKSNRNLLAGLLFSMMLLMGAGIQAQEVKPGDQDKPDERWDVRKEYDENGNLYLYDSSYSRTWKNFDFPEFDAGPPFENLDSLFGDYFHFPDEPFGHPPLVFGPFGEFMDSLDLDFYLDSSIFQTPHVFMPFPGLPDTARGDSCTPGWRFPDALLPFDPGSFTDPHEFFRRHHEWMERFFDEFTIPDDTLDHFHPRWQQLPDRQKNPPQGTEI
jgi:hypothetical protein